MLEQHIDQSRRQESVRHATLLDLPEEIAEISLRQDHNATAQRHDR